MPITSPQFAPLAQLAADLRDEPHDEPRARRDARWNASRTPPARVPPSSCTSMPTAARAAADAHDALAPRGHRALAARGHSGVGEGPLRHRRPGDARRFPRARRRAAREGRRARGRPPATRGRRDRRSHEHERIRVLRARPEPALRHAAVALSRRREGRRTHRGRLVVGRGGVGRRRHGGHCARHRHRRLDPHPVGAVRPHRLQADREPHSDARRRAAFQLRSIRSGRSACRSRAARSSTAFWPAASPTCRPPVRSTACASAC